MPELPEVETIKRSMSSNIGARVERLEIRRTDIIRQKDYSYADIYDKAIVDVWRRGKFIVFSFDEGLFLIVHLGMSGRFYMLNSTDEVKEKHVHFIVYLNNNLKLVFQDTRRFGGIRFVRDTELFFARMGCEPLDEGFTSQYLEELLKNRKLAIKNLLLNQNFLAGIGNIYADEALFAAGIKPDRPAGSLNKDEVERLHFAIINVLQKSIEECGTTFRDYRDANNQAGNFQNFLKVYGRSNQACKVCGSILCKEIIGGRSSHYCPNCQK